MNLPGLAQALDDLAARGDTVTYGALARALDVPGPGSIARLTTALEVTMAEDAAEGRPFRAAACAGRLAGELPASGFFAAARLLGRYTGPDQGPEAAAFVHAQRAALFNRGPTG